MNTTPDMLIIGAGAAGGSVARALSTHLSPNDDRSILILERGERLPREAENWDVERVYGDEERYKTDERWFDCRTGEDFRANMYYTVGGNTKTYGSALIRLRPRDFEEYATADGLSPSWPISYDTLAPYYDRAERAFYVHGEAGSDPFEPPRSGPFPYDPLPHAPRIAALADDLAQEGLHPMAMPMGVRLSADRPRRGPFTLPETFRAAGTETFDGFPDITGMKADAETCAVDHALTQDGVTLVTGAYVSRLIPNPSGTGIEAVEVDHQGETVTIRPGLVVLAAGAINSAALLLRSTSATAPEGLGNRYDQVGRHFMRHVTSKFYAVSPTVENDTYFQKTLCLNDFYWGTAEDDTPLGHIHLMGKHNAFMIGRDLGLSEDEARPIAAHSVDWWVQSEDLPLSENRITLSPDGRIGLRWTPTNTAPHQRLMDVTQTVLERIGFSEFHRVTMPLRVVNHQCGTLRMGIDPRESVTDALGAVHGFDNLYVADAGLFPSSAATNPTLTIVALAYRLADHLAADRL